MLLDVLSLVAGLALLAVSSDRFVLGAVAIAHNLGVTPMVVGLTVVSLGTSAPEMLVSGAAAWQGTPGLALGNVLGSNIANASLVVGASALVTPLLVTSQTIRREFPILFAVTALAFALMMDRHLSRLDALVLGIALVVVIMVIVRAARSAALRDPLKREIEEERPVQMSSVRAMVWLVVGLALMLAASRLVVFGASAIAESFGISDLVIGLTVVAVGTSLPELAASIASVRKGHPDMAIGNVLGSNMFNLLPVLAVAALVAPFDVVSVALWRDYSVMAALTLVLFLTCVGWRGPGQVTRLEGCVLLAGFVSYQGLLYVMRA